MSLLDVFLLGVVTVLFITAGFLLGYRYYQAEIRFLENLIERVETDVLGVQANLNRHIRNGHEHSITPEVFATLRTQQRWSETISKRQDVLEANILSQGDIIAKILTPEE